MQMLFEPFKDQLNNFVDYVVLYVGNKVGTLLKEVLVTFLTI